MRKTHYRSSTVQPWPVACGAKTISMTDIKRQVTCLSCRHTRYFRLSRSEVQPDSPAKMRTPK